LPFYDELFKTLSNKHTKLIADSREYPDLPKSLIDQIFDDGPTHLRAWREPDYRTDLYLFKHMDIWRIMVRMEKLKPGELGGGLAIMQGYDI